jgi:hypothetical protein
MALVSDTFVLDMAAPEEVEAIPTIKSSWSGR